MSILNPWSWRVTRIRNSFSLPDCAVGHSSAAPIIYMEYKPPMLRIWSTPTIYLLEVECDCEERAIVAAERFARNWAIEQYTEAVNVLETRIDYLQREARKYA
jgi:hypothetical protein